MKIGIDGERLLEERERKGERLALDRHDQSEYTNILPSAIFATIYAASLIVSIIMPELDYDFSDRGLFVEWQEFTVASFTKLCSSIALTFFLPGYALISIIFTSKQRFGFLLKIFTGLHHEHVHRRFYWIYCIYAGICST